MRRRSAAVTITIGVFACAPPPGAASEPQLRMLDSAKVSPCTDSAAIAAARASGALTAPTMLRMPIPPVPIPAHLRSTRVDMRIRVDSIGLPDTASTVVSGIPPTDPYARSLRRLVGIMTFFPAQMRPSYCSVSAIFVLQMELGVRRREP